MNVRDKRAVALEFGQRRLNLRWCIAATLACYASGSFAAEPSPAPMVLEQVVITARKTEESAQNVPVSVTALSQENLSNSVVLSVTDLQSHVPGLVVSASALDATPSFSIRVAKQDVGTAGGIATYIDDVPVPASMTIANAMYDLSSVSVLKGPQGTLFGTNATGGAIIFRPNKPTANFEGYAQAGYGNYDRREFEGMVNVPITDTLQVRLAGNAVKRDGIIKNIRPSAADPSRLQSLDYQSLRFSLRFKPIDGLTNDLVADYYHEDDTPPQQYLTQFTPNLAAQGVTLLPWNTVAVGQNYSGIDWPASLKVKSWGAADTLNYEFTPDFSVKNVLGYRSDDVDAFAPSDGLPVYAIKGRSLTKYKQWTDELSVHLTALDERLHYTGGVFVSERQMDAGTSYAIGQTFVYPSPLVFTQQRAYYVRDYHSYAAYSQASYDITKELTATLGFRYTWDSGKFSNNQHVDTLILPDATGNFFGPPSTCLANVLSAYPTFDLASCTAHATKSWHAPSYTVSLEDKFTEGSMIYFVSRGGYQAGGFNNAIRDQALQTYQPEKVTDFEVGIKSDWTLFGRPARTNVDVFYGQYRDMQRTSNGSYSDRTNWIAVFNAGSATYYGTDLEFSIYATEGLELSGSWTRVKSAYDSFVFPAVGTSPANNLSNQTLAQTPQDTVAASADYSWPIGDGHGQVHSKLTYYYTSEIAFQDVPNTAGFADGDALNRQAGYSLWNFSTGWKGILGSTIDLDLWVKNLTDKEYAVSKRVQGPLGWAGQINGEPRTYGAYVKYNF